MGRILNWLSKLFKTETQKFDSAKPSSSSSDPLASSNNTVNQKDRMIDYSERGAYLNEVIEHVQRKGNPTEENFIKAVYHLFAGANAPEVPGHEHAFEPLMQSPKKDTIIDELGRKGVFKYLRDNKQVIESKLNGFYKEEQTNSSVFKVDPKVFQENLKLAQEQNYNRHKSTPNPRSKIPVEELSAVQLIRKRLDLGRPNPRNQQEINEVDKAIKLLFPLKTDRPKNPNSLPLDCQNIEELFSDENSEAMNSNKLSSNRQLSNRIVNSIRESDNPNNPITEKLSGDAKANLETFQEKVNQANAKQRAGLKR